HTTRTTTRGSPQNELTTKLKALPSSYFGNGWPTGGDQSDVSAQWMLGAIDVRTMGNRLRKGEAGAVNAEVFAAADAADSLAAGVQAVGGCIANDDPNFGGVKIIGASVCEGLYPQVKERAADFGKSLVTLYATGG
ncbi:MAG: hypothetical protein JWM72_1752, partial [Actinomycetia bacterium]|nr:hypothetical protein [Actinomycetes bacterium]